MRRAGMKQEENEERRDEAGGERGEEGWRRTGRGGMKQEEDEQRRDEAGGGGGEEGWSRKRTRRG